MTIHHGPPTQAGKQKRGLLIMRGLPASGKTTYAHQFVSARRAEGISAIRIGRDDVRNLLCLSEQPRQKCVGSGKDEKMVTFVETKMIRAAFKSGIRWVVEDSTNLNNGSFARLTLLGEALGADVFTVTMNASVEECVARDVLRVDSCGEEVIRAMASRDFRAMAARLVEDE